MRVKLPFKNGPISWSHSTRKVTVFGSQHNIMKQLYPSCHFATNKTSKVFSYRCLSSITSDTEAYVDTLIIGGGVMGTSTAYHLAKARSQASSSSSSSSQSNSPSIIVVERDPTYQHASSSLSAGGIRQQFSVKENIQMTLYGRDFLRNASEWLSVNCNDTTNFSPQTCDVAFHENGYLFLTASQTGAEQMKTNHQLQQSLGCDIHLLSPSELNHKFGSWLKNTDNLTLGSYGASGEGYFDPWALLCGMKEKAIELGVQFVQGQAVQAEFNNESGEVTSVHVQQNKKGNNFSRTDTKKNVQSDAIMNDVGQDMIPYYVKNVVNAAGASASPVMEMLLNGSQTNYHELPVRARKRCIFFFHCSSSDGVPQPNAPMMIDSDTNVYFRPEGGGLGQSEQKNMQRFLCGCSPAEDDDPDYDDHPWNLEHVDHDAFENVIWPVLYDRVPAFESIKVKSYWAGFYDYNTIDQNAIIGLHPDARNVFLINGFSGHGIQQSPAAGRAVAELIENDGRFETLDLGIFGFERFMDGGSPVYEAGIV